MCGRYVLKASAIDLQREFRLAEVPPLSARYNIAPMQAAPIITDAQPSKLTIAQWGLLPRWAKSEKQAHQLINARAESILEKPAYKELVHTHRCLVPCDGFYEWRHEGAQRLPHFVHRRDGHLLALAGLWSRWHDVDTFTIVTTDANPALRELHDRMPVILDADAQAAWLGGASVDVLPLLKPWEGPPLELTPVSTHVNSVQVDDARCLEPPATVQLRLL
jgi:putative SOS response-associated peptidase YedK